MYSSLNCDCDPLPKNASTENKHFRRLEENGDSRKKNRMSISQIGQ